MSPYKAQIKLGACFGSLWKQHTASSAKPPNLTSFQASLTSINLTSSITSTNSNLSDDGYNTTNNNGDLNYNSDDSYNNNEGATTMSTSEEMGYERPTRKTVATLTAALDKNERGKYLEFCVLVGNTLLSYENFTAFRRGDHPASEVRIVGASAWNPAPPSTKSKASSFSLLSSKKRNSSTILQSSSLSTTPSNANSPTFQLVTHAGTHIYCSAQTMEDRDLWLSALHTGLEITYAGYVETLLMFYQQNIHRSISSTVENGSKQQDNSGTTTSTNITPTTPIRKPKSLTTVASRDTLEPTILTPPVPKRGARMEELSRRITNTKKYESQMEVLNNNHNYSYNASSSSPPNSMNSTPINSRNNSPRRRKSCAGAGNASPTRTPGSPINSYSPYDAPLFSNDTVSKVHCLSCGRYPPESAMKANSPENCPLPQYGMENRVMICMPCTVGQGLLRHVNVMTGLYASDTHERLALVKARELVVEVWMNVLKEEEEERAGGGGDGEKEVGRMASVNELVEEENTSNGGSGNTDMNESGLLKPNKSEDMSYNSADSWMKLVYNTNSSDNETRNEDAKSSTPNLNSTPWGENPPTPRITEALTDLMTRSDYAAFCRRSNTVDRISSLLERGGVGCVAEFLETLDERAKEAVASCDVLSEKIRMKKEALEVGGDMSAALKMLREHALPKENMGISSYENADVLACILEFFLDMCEGGQLTTVGFFWPQMSQIYMQMLPPTDVESMIRVELMEDFLLTVCVKYSVHLSLELVWACLADLEDAMGALPSVGCRRRRFALLRFVCELESLIFDFDGGWGGGSVCLRKMLSPSEHQSTLIRDAMGVLQLHRMFSAHHLKQSVRFEKLHAESEVAAGVNAGEQTLPASPMDAAKRKYEIARNAEYFSTQLMFCRRLGDIAEGLFPMDDDDRGPALVNDLQILNSSGRLGGDPMNQISEQEHGLVNVLHIPEKEGHVFRSKERTPVLLLMETVRDESMIIGNSKKESKTKDKAKSNVQKTDAESSDRSKDISTTTDIFSKDLNQNMKPDDGYESPEEDTILAPPTPSQRDRLNSTPKCVLGTPKAIEGVTPSNVHSMETLVSNMLQEKMKVSLPDLEKDESFDTPVEEFQDGILTGVSSDGQSSGNDNQEDGNECIDEHNAIETEGTNNEGQNEVTIEGEKLESPTTNGEAEGGNEDKVKKLNSQIETNADSSSTPSTQELDQLDSNELSSDIVSQRKISPFSEVDEQSKSNLAANGEGRRQVLTTIFVKGMRSINPIARGVAPAARQAVQRMDSRRAAKLMSRRQLEIGTNLDSSKNSNGSNIDSAPDLPDLNNNEYAVSQPSEEDECMESLRLILIQNRVACGHLSPENAARSLTLSASAGPGTSTQKRFSKKDGLISDEFDVGAVDPRLSGCGSVSEAVLSALKLWKEGHVSNGELLELIQKDLKYTQLALPGATNESKLIEDSAFWGRFAFGERWAEKKARIQSSSVHGTQPGWDLSGVIIKSNDDLRQEAFAMQLIELCGMAFEMSGLELWLQPYRILATGRRTGVIEMVKNAMSFDSLKKRPGYNTGGLYGHFKKMSECAADPAEAMKTAQRNFVRSCASYSLISYLFMFKDRHNGNILLDTAGHVIHIDFGFVFGIAPGGSFSLEQSVPFKLTEEMIEVMGGINSPMFSEFVTLFCCGFLSLKAHAEAILTLVEITSEGSTFKCFENKDTAEIVNKLRERFCLNLSKEATIAHAMELIRQATLSYGTKQYDFFQYLSQGIAA